MHPIRRGLAALVVGSGLAVMVVGLDRPAAFGEVLLVGVILGYLLWMFSLLGTWIYWGRLSKLPSPYGKPAKVISYGEYREHHAENGGGSQAS